MADAKITALTAATSISADDLLVMVDDPGSSPITKKITFANVEASLTAATTSADGVVELATSAETLAGTSATLAVTPDGLYSGITWKKCGTISNPQAWYAQRAQIVLFRAEANLTIARIHIHGSDTSPTSELAGDLKFADDINIGGFASATVIDVCDTTNGVVTITSSFDDATVPSGKYVYFQMDASPHADWKDFYIEVYYTLD